MSKSINDFTLNRCDEITLKDPKYNSINTELLKAEKELSSILSQFEQKRLFMRYIDLTIKLEAYVQTLLYTQGSNDGIIIKKHPINTPVSSRK